MNGELLLRCLLLYNRIIPFIHFKFFRFQKQQNIIFFELKNKSRYDKKKMLEQEGNAGLDHLFFDFFELAN